MPDVGPAGHSHGKVCAVGSENISLDAAGRAPGRPPTGRLSLYWPLRSMLPVPGQWLTRLTQPARGDLVHSARIGTDREAIEGVVDESLVVQAFFVHLPFIEQLNPLAWHVVNRLGLPHSGSDSIGSPDMNVDDFRTILFHPSDPHPTVADPVADTTSDPGANAVAPGNSSADVITGGSETDLFSGPSDGQAAGDLDHRADDGAEDDAPSGLTHTTVVYAAAALPMDPGPDDIAAAVNEIEELVQTTTRALHAVTGMGYQLPTLASTTLEVLIGFDETVRGSLEPRWNIGHYTTRGLGFALRDQADVTIADTLAHAELDATRHSYRSLVNDLQRQAVAAGRRQGDTRTAVVMAAATCEAWVDLMAGALLWEQGATPEHAARELGGHRTMKDRLHQNLAPRLGGSWDIKTTPALRAWDIDVRAARNRVLHAGGLPSAGLAERGINAMYGLLTYTLDRLCSPTARNRHPVSAILLANRIGLEARNGWTRRIRNTATEMDRDDLNGAFNRWYSSTSQLLLAPSMQPTPSDPALQMVALPDGRTYWIERDPHAALARLAHLDPSDAAALEAYRPDTSDGVGKTVSFDIAVEYVASAAWMAEHNLVPGAAVMRDVSTWQHPPAAPVQTAF